MKSTKNSVGKLEKKSNSSSRDPEEKPESECYNLESNKIMGLKSEGIEIQNYNTTKNPKHPCNSNSLKATYFNEVKEGKVLFALYIDIPSKLARILSSYLLKIFKDIAIINIDRVYTQSSICKSISEQGLFSEGKIPDEDLSLYFKDASVQES